MFRDDGGEPMGPKPRSLEFVGRCIGRVGCGGRGDRFWEGVGASFIIEAAIIAGAATDSDDALSGEVEEVALRPFEVVVRGESRPLPAIAEVIAEVGEMVETVEREEGLRAERAD